MCSTFFPWDKCVCISTALKIFLVKTLLFQRQYAIISATLKGYLTLTFLWWMVRGSRQTFSTFLTD